MLHRSRPARRVYLDPDTRELVQRAGLLADGQGRLEIVRVFPDGVCYAAELPRRLVRRLVPELTRAMDSIVVAMEADIPERTRSTT